MNKNQVITGLVLIILSIVLGAFAAHGLKKIILDVEKLSSFETAVRYQMYTGIALLSVGLSNASNKFDLKLFFRLLIVGVGLFSGSIYILSLSEVIPFKVSFLGPITPIGGVLMIVAWTTFLLKVIRYKE